MSKYDPTHVILVNEQDEWLGSMEKLEAHKKGALHRAISVFVMNDENEMLLQQRATGKYHSGGLWSNACCSHPAPGESTMHAAQRRMKEELGVDCQPQPAFNLRYRADVGNNLIENEYDHIFSTTYSGTVNPNPEEVQEHRYVPLTALQDWMKKSPQDFTPWFHMAMPRYLDFLQRDNITS